MKALRANLTRIKNNIEAKLPSEGDILEYPGVNRQLLIDGLTECVGLIDGLEDKKETLDVIVLKREFADLSRKCLDFLNAYPNEKSAQDFNEFLKSVAEIRRIINSTYLLVVKESLRPEATLASLQVALDEIIPKTETLIKTQVESEKSAAEIAQLHEKVAIHSADLASRSAEAKQELEATKELHIKTDAISNECSNWAAEIEENELAIQKQCEAINKNEAISASQKNAFELGMNKLNEGITTLDGQTKRNKELQNEIYLTIGDANRSSMAGSFKKRKDEIDRPLKNAERFLFFALLAFGGMAYLLFKPHLAGTDIDYRDSLLKVPILLPFLWMAWFYTKKVGHLNRIQEDYAFKYAAAMAFEGYDKHCADDAELSKMLLTLSIENMGANPIRLYGDGDAPSGPIPEMLDRFTGAWNAIRGKQVEIKK